MSFLLAQVGSGALQGVSMSSRLGIAVVVSLFVAGGLMWGVPEFLEGTIRRVKRETLRSFLWGLGVFIALLFLVRVVALAPVVGKPLAAFAGLLLLVVAYVGQIVVYIHVARLALDRQGVDSESATVVAAVALAVVVSLIPAIGVLASFVVGALGLGAIVKDQSGVRVGESDVPA
ncbi:hypothetical protein [Halocalculus aciditolerans]|uniref:DUF8173 domain-containing protein n=1 Tax=Halocalculus aciditolerans TaxID=1383812 RepID=A0A830FL53_9EURY|nr:hypothetical protein [Halocalculus aciditolerans]GGL57133.1 hypothetical protein GCM10009039_14130 [Halocalculus aciditolerans]